MQFTHPDLIGITVITLDKPPVNSLSQALRSRIVAAIGTAEADPGVRGIVLAGNDRAFSAGADVTELGTSRQLTEPTLGNVLACVENCTKPVVAAISGVALGGGLELALACHARMALDTAKLGFPEINLGLIPGSGGTQRLPRLVGLDVALDMVQSGQPRTATQLADSGLLDGVVTCDLLASAMDKAHELAIRLKSGAALPRARDRQPNNIHPEEWVQVQLARLPARQRLQPARTALLDALAASNNTFGEGMKRERELFLALLSSSPAQALRYQFKAERAATKLPVEFQGEARQVQTLAVIGAGIMGAEIAISALDAGFGVLLLEQSDSALHRGQQRVAGHYQSRIRSGKMKASAAAAAEARLTLTTNWTLLIKADVVIEAVFEDLAVKQAVFRQIDQHARPGAVLATKIGRAHV